ncbi:protein starmaker [Folsomia candida]|uniref:protein starmaker n=1 Tax=Folsomia candida TaxID=158441 RepID=UPI000B9044DC|nr:protein starmaker [Folsomia candida]
MNIYSLIVLGILHGTVPIHSADGQSGVHKTSGSPTPSLGAPLTQNFTEIHSPKDLSSSSSNRKAKRQSGRGSKSSKPKVKNYSGPNGYLQVIESEPQSYSTSYHHSSEQPTKAYSNTKRSKHGTDTRDERQKSRDNDDDYDYDDDRASHREREPEKKKKRYRSEDEDDADSSDIYDSGTKGYERSSKYNREKNDDYKKSGEIDFDTDNDDDYGTSRSGSNRGGGRRGGGQKKYRSSNRDRDSDDYQHSDASSDNGKSRSSDDNEEDFYKGYDEVDSYGQTRQRGGKRGKKNSRERSNRDDDEVERRDNDDDGEGDNYRRGSSTRPKSSSQRRGPADDSDFDFEFNASDPFGEENAGDHRKDKSPKYISSTV